jgi:hypothetical protein
VKNSVDLLACGVWAMRCIALLWRDILKPFMCGFSHVERRCGHVSLPIIRAQGAIGVLVCECLYNVSSQKA